MMFINKILLFCLSATQLSLILLVNDTSAFVVPSYQASPAPAAANSITAAASQQQPDSTTTELAAFSRRREVFNRLRNSVFAGGLASMFTSKPVFAEETSSAPSTGRIITFEIGNLGGEEGKTGTVKIQMRPEWAPLGVKRFEVSLNGSFFFVYPFMHRAMKEVLTLTH